MKERYLILGAIIIGLGIMILGFGILLGRTLNITVFLPLISIGAFMASLGGIISVIGIAIPNKIWRIINGNTN